VRGFFVRRRLVVANGCRALGCRLGRPLYALP
jgi:hypothetical protein